MGAKLREARGVGTLLVTGGGPVPSFWALLGSMEEEFAPDSTLAKAIRSLWCCASFWVDLVSQGKEEEDICSWITLND